MSPLRPYAPTDFETVYEIVNAAVAYRGVIPPDRQKEPYIPRDELATETEYSIQFWGR
mgnify:CR=1 FL=1